jgi:hypothetical protein
MTRKLALVAIVLVLSSCAGPAQLARQSQDALDRGDETKAYQLARKAMDRDPDLAAARASYTNVALRLDDGWKTRVRNLAVVDSIGAARRALDFAAFRAEVARYGVALPFDPAYRAEETSLLEHAAATQYERAVGSLADGRPKRAYEEFLDAGGFMPGYRDVEARAAHALDLATTTVALLPFEDQVHIPGLARELTDLQYEEIARNIGPTTFRFTRILAPEDVYDHITVAQMERPGGGEAVRMARAIGADRAVSGRVLGLRSDTRTEVFHTTLYRRVSHADTSGRERIRYVAVPFDAVTRERDVHVEVEFEIVDARDESVVGHHEEEYVMRARTFFTSFAPEGNCADYALSSPDLSDASSDFNAQWKGAFGSWSVPALLECARRERGRSGYLPGYRSEFLGSTAGRPVFLDDLPPPEALVEAALAPSWGPIFDELLRLDAEE